MKVRVLKLVEALDAAEPCFDYEHEQRRKIASRNWSAVHVAGDRAPPLDLVTRLTRGWRQ